MARFTAVLLYIFVLFNLSLAKDPPKTDYDVIIVGGGPGGLAAMSALCRVSRRAVLFDTQMYRNNKTRNMHDVLGNDGLPPAEFRAAARAQINKYDLATFINKEVMEISSKEENGFKIFTAVDADRKKYTARRVILATGVTDDLPQTPGVWDAFGKGLYWCPWCDGFEHRGQSLGVLGPLSDALSSVIEMHNINPDTIVLANGSNVPAQRELATNRSATWEKQLEAYSVPIINNTITKIVRLRDGGDACSSPGHMKVTEMQQVITKDEETKMENTIKDVGGKDVQVIPTRPDAGPNGLHYDLFRVEFEHGLTIERAAFILNAGVFQTSNLPQKLKLSMDGSKVNITASVETSVSGIYAVGDMTNNGATNVPWAMYSGKKAAVFVHVGIAREDSRASIVKRSLFNEFSEYMSEKTAIRQIGDELEKIWNHIRAQYRQ